MSETTKRYLFSVGLTFLSGFLLVIVPALDSITMESFKDGTVVGLLFAATRTGLKAALEWFQGRIG